MDAFTENLNSEILQLAEYALLYGIHAFSQPCKRIDKCMPRTQKYQPPQAQDTIHAQATGTSLNFCRDLAQNLIAHSFKFAGQLSFPPISLGTLTNEPQ